MKEAQEVSVSPLKPVVIIEGCVEQSRGLVMVPPGKVEEESGNTFTQGKVDSPDTSCDLGDVFWGHSDEVQEFHDLTLVSHDAVRG